MNESNKQDGQVSPRQPLGSPVGGNQAPVSPASAPSPALMRILARIEDPDLCAQLLTPKGGQFCRAVAAELDVIGATIDGLHTSLGPPKLMADVEAQALIRFLDNHFSISGHVPRADERLVDRVMMTLKALADQLIVLQRSASQASGTPTA